MIKNKQKNQTLEQVFIFLFLIGVSIFITSALFLFSWSSWQKLYYVFSPIFISLLISFAQSFRRNNVVGHKKKEKLLFLYILKLNVCVMES